MAVKPLWTITYGFSDEATFADQAMHVLAESAGEAIDEFERHIALESEPQIRSVARSTTMRVHV